MSIHSFVGGDHGGGRKNVVNDVERRSTKTSDEEEKEVKALKGKKNFQQAKPMLVLVTK